MTVYDYKPIWGTALFKSCTDRRAFFFFSSKVRGEPFLDRGVVTASGWRLAGSAMWAPLSAVFTAFGTYYNNARSSRCLILSPFFFNLE